MKIYVPVYSNGEPYEDYYEETKGVGFLTEEKCIEWINSKGYTRVTNGRYTEYRSNNPDDWTIYWIIEIEVEE